MVVGVMGIGGVCSLIISGGTLTDSLVSSFSTSAASFFTSATVLSVSDSLIRGFWILWVLLRCWEKTLDKE